MDFENDFFVKISIEKRIIIPTKKAKANGPNK